MKTKTLILVVAAMTFLAACKKNPTEEQCMIIGNSEGMVITQYDSTIAGGYHQPVSIELDADGDGSYDLRITSVVWGSPATGGNPSSSIACLHPSIQFRGYFTNDTIFKNYREDFVPISPYLVEWHKYSIYSCQKLEPLATISHINLNEFKLIASEHGDQISPEDIYKADTLILADDSYGLPPTDLSGKADTMIFNHTYYFNDCNSFPLQKACYIAFRIGSQDKYRYGWLKLAIFGKNIVLVLHTAIQEN
jgi:hypothetical protein